MKLVSTIAQTRSACRSLRSTRTTTLGLVPTMGALHEGHLSLVRAARQRCDHVVASIFVNPTQFGPGEDLDRYPRTLENDCALLEGEGVDLAFAPTAAEMYPSGTLSTFVDPGEVGNRLDGRTRPGHFRGVATVVSKLFSIVCPDSAFFGQKDAAQVAVLRAMVRDLDMPLEMIVCPTVRDTDGLALSSRNRFLTPEQRREALALSQALSCATQCIKGGQRDAAALIARMLGHLKSPQLRLDYVEVVDANTLLPQNEINADSLLAIAAYLGETRLIDNQPVAEILPEAGR